MTAFGLNVMLKSKLMLFILLWKFIKRARAKNGFQCVLFHKKNMWLWFDCDYFCVNIIIFFLYLFVFLLHETRVDRFRSRFQWSRLIFSFIWLDFVQFFHNQFGSWLLSISARFKPLVMNIIHSSRASD